MSECCLQMSLIIDWGDGIPMTSGNKQMMTLFFGMLNVPHPDPQPRPTLIVTLTLPLPYPHCHLSLSFSLTLKSANRAFLSRAQRILLFHCDKLVLCFVFVWVFLCAFCAFVFVPDGVSDAVCVGSCQHYYPERLGKVVGLMVSANTALLHSFRSTR